MSTLASINIILRSAAAVALLFLVVIITVDVAMVLLASRPIVGVHDMVETALVCLLFLGLPEVFRRENNISVDIGDYFFSPRAVHLLRTNGSGSAAGFLFLLLAAMLPSALDSVQFGDVKSDSGIPVWLLWAAVLVGAVFSLIGAGIAFYRRIVGLGEA